MERIIDAHLTMAALRLHLLRVGAFGAMERINATPLPFAYVVLLRTFLVLSTSWRAALHPVFLYRLHLFV